VTAGNASGINDGAAAVVVTTGRRRKRSAGGRSHASCRVSTGVDPKIMGMGPVPAVRKVIERAGLKWPTSIFELNEAFAAQSVAVARARAGRGEVNVNGGAIALGHPIGASGAARADDADSCCGAEAALRRASLCIGGGMGIAMAIENLELGIRN
jgi:acetyl-CoA C-acetyltransferase